MKRLVLLTVILIGLAKVSGQNYDISVYTEPQIAWITSNHGGVAANGAIMHINAGIELDLFFAKNYGTTWSAKSFMSGCHYYIKIWHR